MRGRRSRHRGHDRIAVVGLALALVCLAPGRSAWARPFHCAGQVAQVAAPATDSALAKPARAASSGTRQAIVLFARFADQPDRPVPDWGPELLDPDRPGSLAHFYDTMSLGQLKVRGEVGPRVYASTQQGTAYLPDDSTKAGEFGRFSLEILTQADAEIDFAQYDNDGPDGVPNSGDDDGVVDAVFLVVASAPDNFLLGAATGIAGLGFSEDSATAGLPVERRSFVTRDRSANGALIRIAAGQGTIQQGRNLAEVAGAMCHEYGHLLGLPDLYNTDYLQRPGALPEEDSAGVGAWCLMGWGASGWNGGDGPNSLCAWSRARLGWARVSQPDGAQSEMSLEEVGAHGQVYQIPLSRRESYWIEYRRRNSTWYDRHLPAEGVLIWHSEQGSFSGKQAMPTRVELECADGRWEDAGYPLGRRADAMTGGTNLDFWAHDTTYTRIHAGNLGDATDPFDGVRFTAFTPQTNPAAISSDGQQWARLEGIRLDGSVVRATVEVLPAQVRFTRVTVHDSTVMSGQAVSVSFIVANRGSTPAVGLRVRLLADDPLIEVLDPEIGLVDLAAGQVSLGATVSPQGFPRFRFLPLDEARPAVVGLELYDAEGRLADWAEVPVTGVPAYQVSGAVRDAGGQPLAGIPVAVQSYSGVNGIRPGIQISQSIRTDADGRYCLHLPAGTYRLDVQPPLASPWGAQSRVPISILADTTIGFSLFRAYLVQGHLYDPDGYTVGATSMQFTRTDGTWSGWAYVEGNGGYQVKVPAGRYRVTSSNTDRYAGQEVAEIEVEADQTLDLHLQAGAKLVLHTANEQGEPVPGVFFYLVPMDDQPGAGVRSVVTQRAEAIAEVEVLHGRYRLQPSSVPAPYLSLPARPLTVHGDTTVTVVLTRGVMVSGRLLTDSGLVLPALTGGSVSFAPIDGGSGGLGYLDSRDEEAFYAVGVSPGRYQVRVSFFEESGRLPSQALGTVEVRADTSIDLVVRIGVVVRGWLIDGKGDALSPGSASLTFTDPAGDASWISVLYTGQYGALLLPGVYRVRLESDSTSVASPPSQELGTLTVAADTSVDWSVRAGERISGRIVDAAGQAMTGWYVSAAPLEGNTSPFATVEADGSFSLALLPGRYRLQVGQPAAPSSVYWNLGQLEVPAVLPIELTIPSGAALRVQVRDADGQPASADLALVRDPRELHGLGPGDALVVAMVGGDGQRVLPMAPGLYSLAAYGFDALGDSEPLGRVLRDLEVHDTLAVEVTLPAPGPTLRVSGQVRGAGVGESVLVQLCDETQGIAARSWTTHGRYQVDVPAGTYWLSAGRSWGADVSGRGPMTIQTDTTWDVTLDAESTAVLDAAAALPQAFALGPSYPNPFNGSAMIPFSVPRAGPVELVVYNVAGQVVRRLVTGVQPAGEYLSVWDGRDDQGRTAASGVYLCRLETAGQRQVRRLVLLR